MVTIEKLLSHHLVRRLMCPSTYSAAAQLILVRLHRKMFRSWFLNVCHKLKSDNIKYTCRNAWAQTIQFKHIVCDMGDIDPRKTILSITIASIIFRCQSGALDSLNLPSLCGICSFDKALLVEQKSADIKWPAWPGQVAARLFTHSWQSMQIDFHCLCMVAYIVLVHRYSVYGCDSDCNCLCVCVPWLMLFALPVCGHRSDCYATNSFLNVFFFFCLVSSFAELVMRQWFIVVQAITCTCSAAIFALVAHALVWNRPTQHIFFLHTQNSFQIIIVSSRTFSKLIKVKLSSRNWGSGCHGN